MKHMMDEICVGRDEQLQKLHALLADSVAGRGPDLLRCRVKRVPARAQCWRISPPMRKRATSA
jgi:hypothetical protein